MRENNNTDLNEVFEEEMDDADVITVPIDETLSKAGEAADAKAVGDALALKADKSELQAAVKVNNQPADAQGLILIDGRHIPVNDQDAETLAVAVKDLKGKTAENILMSSNSGAKTIAEVVNANAEAIESMEEMTGAKMPIESGSQTTVKAAIEARVKTVNRKVPDADGDVDLSVVPLAENLQSDKMESVGGSFIIRMTGGNASVSDGKAYPLHLFGSADHTGYVAEQLNMTVIPITRTEPDEPITATIDRDTFVAYVEESGTINLYYTTEWSADPELYGIIVTGTPVAGDQITVEYVKEVRGTITVANPARLVGTGWNLFDYNNGYAHVVKYSTEYGYKIGGSYTSIQFSATLTGERTSITPSANGMFNVNSDGYVFVTGGNNTDTYILATWSDWKNGPSTGYWESYRESGIDLSAVMTTYFPNGLLAVGTIRDEIDLSAKRSISRIERLAYSEENRAAAAATGRSYDFDQNYIYIARESSVLSAITIDTTYNVSEHGLELFTETALPVITEILYGKNLRDKLERDVLTISQQDLAAEEQAQVRRNIGVMDPPLNGNGTAAQLLKTNGDGTTEWTTQGTPTDAQVGTAVSAWLEEHPEATTTVQDGAISRAKLNDDLKAKTDAVSDLKSAFKSNTAKKDGLINGFALAEMDVYQNLKSESIHRIVNDNIVINNTRIILATIKGKTVSNMSPVVSGIKIYGKNLLDISASTFYYTFNDVRAKNFVCASANENKDYSWISAYAELPAGIYSLSFKAETDDSQFVPFISIYNSEGSLVKTNCYAKNKNTFTIDNAGRYEFRMLLQNGAPSGRSVRFSNVQVEIGERSTTYCHFEPVKTISFPATEVQENETILVLKQENGLYKIVKGTFVLAENLQFDDVSAINSGGIIAVINTNEENVQPDVEMTVFTNNGQYITPQMFGALGDGIKDDTDAMVSAFNSKLPLYIPTGVYLVNESLSVYNDVKSEYDATIKAGSRIEELIKICPEGSATNSIIGIDVDINIDGDNTAVTGVALYYIRQSKLKFRIANFRLYGFHYGKVTYGNNENSIELFINDCWTGVMCDGNDSVFNRVIVINCLTALELKTHFICNEFHAWLTDEANYENSIGIRITEGGTSFQITDFRQDQIRYGIYLNSEHASVSGVVTNYRHAVFGISENSKIYHVFGNTDKYSTLTILNLNGGRNLSGSYFDYYPKVIFKLLSMNDATLAEAYVYNNANELPNSGVFTCSDSTNLPDGLTYETVYCESNSIENLQKIYKRESGKIYFRRRYSYQNGWDSWRCIESSTI